MTQVTFRSLAILGTIGPVTCTWRFHHGSYVVMIPLDEARGPGTYDVERRDGTSKQIMVGHVGSTPWRRFEDGVECYVGLPGKPYVDRSARPPSITHAPVGPHAPRLNKQRDTVIAPESVIERHIRSNEPLVIDDLKVWVEKADDMVAWPVEGVRMVRVPIAATSAA